MLILGLVWIASHLEYLFPSSLKLLSISEHLLTGFPNQVLAVASPAATQQEILPASVPTKSFTALRPSLNPLALQIFVKGCLIADIPDKQQAELIAKRLKQLSKNGKLDAALLQPGIVDGLPAGKWGDQLIFKIDKRLAARFGRSGELLAIEWINRLRTALGKNSFSLAEAQAKMYGLTETPDTLAGTASWYGPYFHGRYTATGETFDQNELTAAHPSLPFDTYLKVINEHNGRTVIVRINDRGPYFDNRMLDLSREAARRLGSEDAGVVPVRAVIMQPQPSRAPRPDLTWMG